ncbi:MAG: sodium:proton antiporter, partial [Bacteroidaceae bacterium]|nr:sodium:proton antiporter [Bacteroidaceae bacterium]
MNEPVEHYLPERVPHPLLAAVPLLTLVGLIALILIYLPDDALDGASQMAMVIATSVCVGLSMLVSKMRWDAFEMAIQATVGDAAVSVLILLMIGV